MTGFQRKRSLARRLTENMNDSEIISYYCWIWASYIILVGLVASGKFFTMQDITWLYVVVSCGPVAARVFYCERERKKNVSDSATNRS